MAPAPYRTGDEEIAETRIEFDGGGEFHRELCTRVGLRLAKSGRARRGERLILAKTTVVTVWAVASCALLVLVAQSWWQVLPLAVSLGLALAGVAFDVTHDARHGSFSRNHRVNRRHRTVWSALGSHTCWLRRPGAAPA